jgi:outer membrane receptor protein involved in Fe transport
VQWGQFQTRNFETEPSFLAVAFADPAADQAFSTDFLRTSIYGYHYWNVTDSVQLIGGVSYDRISYPENFRYAPLSGSSETAGQVSPKAGLIWTPTKDSTVRLAYTRSLTGASLDQSYQLEPAQVAGFIQTYRSLIPEAISGPNAGAKIESFGVSLEQKFCTQTYLGLSGLLLDSTVNRQVGTFFWLTDAPASPAQAQENLDYHEYSLSATVNQLLGDDWSLGGLYTLSESKLTDSFPSFNGASFYPPLATDQKSVLQQSDLFAIFNHPCGAFFRFDALWYHQNNENVTMDLPGADFWQFNVQTGYRSPGRRYDITVGILNLTGQDYQLNPLTPYNDLARTRTLFVRFGLNF